MGNSLDKDSQQNWTIFEKLFVCKAVKITAIAKFE